MTPATAPATDAFLIIPGDDAQKTTVADLKARFGIADVRRELEPAPHVVLFPDHPTRRACVNFHKSADFRELKRITFERRPALPAIG